MKVIKIPYDDTVECTVHDIQDRIDDSIAASGRVLDAIKDLIDIEWAEIVLTVISTKRTNLRDFVLIVDEVGKGKAAGGFDLQHHFQRLLRGPGQGAAGIGNEDHPVVSFILDRLGIAAKGQRTAVITADVQNGISVFFVNNGVKLRRHGGQINV